MAGFTRHVSIWLGRPREGPHEKRRPGFARPRPGDLGARTPPCCSTRPRGGLRVSEESTPRAFCLLRCHHTTERIQDTHRRGRPSGSVGDQRHKPPHWWSLRFQEEPTFGTFDGISWAATKLVPTVLICIPRTGLPVLPQPPGSLEETWGVVSLGGCLTLGPRAASGLKTAVDTQSVVIAQPIPRHPAV